MIAVKLNSAGIWFVATGLLSTILATKGAAASPVLPGLAGKHPLTQPQVGELLISELRCAACHRRDGGGLPEKTAPDLADVGSRVAPEFLRRFIAEPSVARPSSTMPDMLGSAPAAKRDEIAAAIAEFLVGQSPHRFQREPTNEADAAAGRQLFHTVGCIACHSPRDDAGRETIQAGVVGLGHLPEKYSLKSLADFLYQPLRSRPSGQMPDMKLTPSEAKQIAAYLLGKTDESVASPPRDAKLAADGKRYFQQFNCAACHKLGDIPASPARALADADATRGCLANDAPNSPRFHLSDEQVQAIRAALAAKPESLSVKTRLAMTLTAFNCIACHVRDDYGGVLEERNPLFQTSEKNLGDEARLPPPLTLAGAKLQPAWMKKVLFDGESVRPYMFTRMPQFGEPNLRELPELLARLDTIEPVELPIPNAESGDEKERAREQELRTAGRDLLGEKALYCVACHNFNGKPSPNNKGIDLMTSYQRLTPSWFYRFMRDPGAYRPRTVMPVSWPGGKAVQKTILKGDTDRQIDAIWYYLSLGTSAQDPEGIRPVETKLDVTDATRTYRGRSSVAGFRGIAVGFPGGLSYAFNAATGSLAAIWHGDFIRVDRSGQGSGAFNPAGRFVALPQDVSFCELSDKQAPWPLRPVMTKEAPVNPDPLYPKNHGYQFKGYYLDDAKIPTFMYRSGEIQIEDRSAPDAPSTGKPFALTRVLQFSTAKDRSIWFRPLVGKIETESDGRFKIPGLRLHVSKAHTALRSSAVSGTQELLIRFDIPTGKSSISLRYELLQ